jgi:hypothetical protein
VLAVLCFGLPAALVRHLQSSDQCAAGRALGLRHCCLWLCCLGLGCGARVLLIPLLSELGAPRLIPRAVALTEHRLAGLDPLHSLLMAVHGSGSVDDHVIIATRARHGLRRRALALLEEAHPRIKDHPVLASLVLYEEAAVVATGDVGGRARARPELLEGHRGELGLQLLRGLHDDRVAALLGPEPVGVALVGGLGRRATARRRSAQVGGDILGHSGQANQTPPTRSNYRAKAAG